MNWYDIVSSLDWEGICMLLCVVMIPFAYMAGGKIKYAEGYNDALRDRRVADRRAKRAYRLAARK